MSDVDWLGLSMDRAIEFYADEIKSAAKEGGDQGIDICLRWLAEHDLFFLLTEILNRRDLTHPFLYDRCREVQAEPDGCLDLWAREHYKSTIITFGKSMDDIIHDPEVTIGLFSHVRPLAKQFLRQIKYEMESNAKLPRLWPNIFWTNPKSDAPKWSEDDGIVVKRKTNPKEQTVEAYGLVDGQPTSKHFKKLVYDDIVTDTSVSTPEQILKTTSALQLSDNLGTRDGIRRFVGTRYHLFDTYRTAIIDTNTAKVRLYPATKNGKEDGEPVLLDKKTLGDKRKKQGVYIFGCQMLLNPVADTAMGFKTEWVKYATLSRSSAKKMLNIYLIADPASGKRAKERKDPDYTSMWVIGAGGDENYYLLDGVRDRLNLTGRAKAYIGLHRKWRPKAAGYEEYGMQADIEFIEYLQAEENYRFPIIPLGGKLSKNDRIRNLVPIYEAGRFFLPNGILYTDHTGATIDLVKVFLEEEYAAFPVLSHDDMLDCKARILDPDMGVVFPDPELSVEAQEFDYQSIENARNAGDDWTLA